MFAQLLLPAMHAAVHALEQGDHSHGEHGGQRGRWTWVITSAGGRTVDAARGAAHEPAHSHGAAHAHSHGGAAADSSAADSSSEAAGFSKEPRLGAVPLAGHHHHGDGPGQRHGAGSLEHFSAFYVEATPPTLAVPFERLAAPVVPLIAGRVLVAAPVRAHSVRGPPLQS